MATQFFNELTFQPPIAELLTSGGRGELLIFTGGNNSGKSAYLKTVISNRDTLYIGVNRFYSFHHMTLYTDNISERDSWYHQMEHGAKRQPYQNFENSFFNTQTSLARLSNAQRTILFETFKSLFGMEISVAAEDPNNDFSNRYISVSGDSLSVTSSGTRLFLGILAALMDDRFTTVAIDEPELGLSPNLQRLLPNIIVRGENKERLLPHHPNIVLSTHSHLFLDFQYPQRNLVVEKSGNTIQSQRLKDIHEVHDVQFRLLGNDLSSLLLPDIIIFVEGDTDKIFLSKILSLFIKNPKVVVQSWGGNIAERLTYWAASLGDFQVSPYRSRTLVVYDAVKQSGIERTIRKLGLPEESLIAWSGNGIEFVYPLSLLAKIYRKNDITYDDLEIESDRVKAGQIAYSKMELCRMVTDAMTVDVKLAQEIQEKLLTNLERLTR